MDDLRREITGCRLCVERFALTRTRHQPRPVVWFGTRPRILIAGQAPGMRVHDSGVPFQDRSGDRLRDWMGISAAAFYDQSKVAIVPMAFCFPGYNAAGSDLAPPKICAATWRSRVMGVLGEVPLTLVIGGYAQGWHLGGKMSVSDRVAGWRDHAPAVFPLPHPSWRNTGWLKRNPFFEADLLPVLRGEITKVLS